jgi:hypothetical protein
MQNLPFKGACYLRDPNCNYILSLGILLEDMI